LFEATLREGVETWAQETKKAKNINEITFFIIILLTAILAEISSEEKRGQ
jgi:hypothetical protein